MRFVIHELLATFACLPAGLLLRSRSIAESAARGSLTPTACEPARRGRFAAPLSFLDRGAHVGQCTKVLRQQATPDSLKLSIFFFLQRMTNPTHTAKRPAEKQDATSPARKTTVLATFRVRAITATVFGDGTISLRRSYKKPTGEWDMAHSLRQQNLADAIEALKQCQQFSAEPKPASE